MISRCYHAVIPNDAHAAEKAGVLVTATKESYLGIFKELFV